MGLAKVVATEAVTVVVKEVVVRAEEATAEEAAVAARQRGMLVEVVARYVSPG
jgi:hypothetical protein